MASRASMIVLFIFATSTITLDAAAQERVMGAPQPVASRFERDIARRHDRGVLVHSMVGVGYSSRASLSGILSLGVGWLPTERTGVTLDGWGVIGSDSLSAGVGPGVTYFFEDSALHLRFTLGAVAIVEAERDVAWSPGASLMFGATPYITPSASLGLGLLVTGYTGYPGDSGAGLSIGLGLSWVLN